MKIISPSRRSCRSAMVPSIKGSGHAISRYGGPKKYLVLRNYKLRTSYPGLKPFNLLILLQAKPTLGEL